MRRHGVPKWGALALIAFLLLDVGSLFALMTTGALEGSRERFPTYQERFSALSEQFGRWAEGVGIDGSTEAVRDLMDSAKVSFGGSPVAVEREQPVCRGVPRTGYRWPAAGFLPVSVL